MNIWEHFIIPSFSRLGDLGSTDRDRELKMAFRLSRNVLRLVWNLRCFQDIKAKILADN